MLLFYVRHGDPVYQPDGLTELGKKQAESLVHRMKECKPDKIFASSSNRAILTAKPTAQYLNKDIELLEWCHEDYAWKEFSVLNKASERTWCFNDNKFKRIFNSDEVRKMDKEWYEHLIFQDTLFKSGIQRVQSEVDNFMLSLGYKHDRYNNEYIPVRDNNDRIALFAHQGFGLVFLSCLLDIPYPLIAMRFDMSHSNITVIEFKGDDVVIPKVLQLSNDSHVLYSGLSTDYQNRIHF